MRSTLSVFSILFLITACGSGSGGDAAIAAAVTRDSAGIQITEYSEAAFEAAPRWELSAEPLATINGEGGAEIIDLSATQLGTMFEDGTVLAFVPRPPGIHRFGADGTPTGQLGRGGEGPGEYQVVAGLTRLGGDSVIVYDLMKRIALLFDKDGTSLDRLQFPLSGTQIPPVLIGRTDGGTWVFQIVNPFQQKPEGSDEIYRIDGPVLAWQDGAEAYDTLFMLPGATSVWGTVEAGGQSAELGRGVVYGANSFLGMANQTIWSTSGEAFVLDGRNADGALERQVRVGLPRRVVTEPDRERYRTVAREQIERYKHLLPPGLGESELAKIDQTAFASHHAALGFMGTDALGRIWATTGVPVLDSLPEWAVFSPQGELIGRVKMPGGVLFAASSDRVAIRREDEETGLVYLDVRGLLFPGD